MSSLFNTIYEGVISNPLTTTLYEKGASMASNICSDPLAILAIPGGVMVGSALLGRAASALTGGYVQLNNVVPQSVRDLFREIGKAMCTVHSGVADLISKMLWINRDFAYKVIAAPIVEEFFFRLPFILASQGIDILDLKILTSPLLEGAIDVTGAQIAKTALATLLSLAFTYAHDNNLDPDQAAGIFAGGLTLSHLALHPNGGGLENTIVAHMTNNLLAP